MFFGAGNLMLPPHLGFDAGTVWSWVTLGFILSGVLLPILAIYAHARLQGTMYDFGKKVSPIFSVVFCILIYIISMAIPGPRTATVTHEMAIAPYFDIPAIVTSTVYFSLVFLFVIKRATILDYIGKFLTPLIVFILVLIIILSSTMSHTGIAVYAGEQTPFFKGFLEGYQTFDTLGGLLIGGVLIISLNLKGYTDYKAKKSILIKVGLIAGLGLTLMYAGLIFQGALYSQEFDKSSSHADLLIGICNRTLGDFGTAFLSILVALACFTTAVGITTGTADYFKGLFKSERVFTITAATACLFGVVVGQLNFQAILVVGIPVLMLVYPITIVFILMNSLAEKWTNPMVFRAVTMVTIAFSIPDMLFHVAATKEAITPVIGHIPLASQGFGWFIPALLVFVFMNVIALAKKDA
jgi:LIVCS family branched-chain amino acid:cation transporter